MQRTSPSVRPFGAVSRAVVCVLLLTLVPNLKPLAPNPSLPAERFDVNRDGQVTPADALEVIEFLNQAPVAPRAAAETPLLPAAAIRPLVTQQDRGE